MIFSRFLEEIAAQVAALLHKMDISCGNVALIGHPDLLQPEAWEKEGFQPTLLNTAEDCLRSSPVAFIVLNLASLSDISASLSILHKRCEEIKVPLIITSPNLSHNDISFALLTGSASSFITDKGSADFVAHTEELLNDLLSCHGFAPVRQKDLIADSCFQFGETDNVFLSSSTLVNQYLMWLKQRVDANGETWCFVRGYLPALPLSLPQKSQASPFLSVVTRTQGMRLQELSEVLLCLNSQSDCDFEVLVVGHKVTPENKKNILQAITDFPPSLSARIRYLEANTGNRSTPLNVGFMEARGQYISILDDDDLIMDNWVESFHLQAKKTPGVLLHAYAVAQDWCREQSTGNLCAAKKPLQTYCKPFNYIHQMVENSCPTMSLAFPSWIFKNTTIRFDENLDTTEDWDVIMRVANVVGVSDIPEITSIYRLWENAEASRDLHTESQWIDNYHVVKQRLNKAPILLPPGSAATLDHYYKVSVEYYRNVAGSPPPPEKCDPAILYISLGEGFSEENTLRVESASDGSALLYRYKLGENLQAAKDIRFDPVPNGDASLRDVSISLTTTAGKTISIPSEHLGSNGFVLDDGFYFFGEDPQLFFSVPVDDLIDCVEIRGQLMQPIPQPYIEILREKYMAGQTASPSFARRAIRRVRRIFSK